MRFPFSKMRLWDHSSAPSKIESKDKKGQKQSNTPKEISKTSKYRSNDDFNLIQLDIPGAEIASSKEKGKRSYSTGLDLSQVEDNVIASAFETLEKECSTEKTENQELEQIIGKDFPNQKDFSQIDESKVKMR